MTEHFVGFENMNRKLPNKISSFRPPKWNVFVRELAQWTQSHEAVNEWCTFWSPGWLRRTPRANRRWARKPTWAVSKPSISRGLRRIVVVGGRWQKRCDRQLKAAMSTTIYPVSGDPWKKRNQDNSSSYKSGHSTVWSRASPLLQGINDSHRIKCIWAWPSNQNVYTTWSRFTEMARNSIKTFNYLQQTSHLNEVDFCDSMSFDRLDRNKNRSGCYRIYPISNQRLIVYNINKQQHGSITVSKSYVTNSLSCVASRYLAHFGQV